MLVNQADGCFHHPDILCRHGWREVWHCRGGKWCCPGERKAGRSGAVSHLGIWQHSDYQQWHAIVCDVHGNIPSKPVRLHSLVPPCVQRWHQHSAPLCDVTHVATRLLCEAGNVTHHCRGHSSIVLVSSGCASWARRVAVVVGQGLGPIHVEASFSLFRTVCGEIRWLNKPTVSSIVAVADLRRSQMKNPDIVVLGRSRHTRSSGMWTVCCRATLLKSTSNTAYCRSIHIEGPCDSPGGHFAIDHANGALP